MGSFSATATAKYGLAHPIGPERGADRFLTLTFVLIAHFRPKKLLSIGRTNNQIEHPMTPRYNYLIRVRDEEIAARASRRADRRPISPTIEQSDARSALRAAKYEAVDQKRRERQEARIASWPARYEVIKQRARDKTRAKRLQREVA